MRGRARRRLAVFLLGAGVLMVAGPMTMAFADSSDSPSLGFFDVSGDANGIGITYGNPSSAPYPTAAGLVPHASAQLGAGPSGHALASLAWPGELAGHGGTLAGLFGLPVPADVLSNANDPVKAEAASAGGHDDQSFGPMHALVDGASSSASTALADFKGAAFLSVGRVVSKSRTYLDGGKAVAEAESDLQDVEIAGVLHIASITSVATGSTDGNTATIDRKMSVSGVTVQGQGATLDETGLHVGGTDSPNPLDPVATGANEALKSIGMKAFVTKPIDQNDSAGSGSVNTGSVAIYWSPDPTDVFTVVLGGSTVTVKATPGSGSDLAGASDLTSGGLPGGSVDSGSFTGTGSLSGDLGGGPSVAVSSGGSSHGSGAPVVGITDLSNATPISDRVPMGWMLIGIAGMVFIGLGLHGVRDTTLAAVAAGSTCPLERGAS